jgi:phosphoserine phosphatase
MSSTTAATPQTLSTEQFLQAVYGAKPKTAVFDFDGTLWPGDAGSGFMRWTIDTGLLSPEAAERILGRHAAYHRGEVDEITICGEMTSIYAGLSEKAIRGSAAQYFVDHVQPKFFPEMVQLVHDLQAAGVEVWAVSSTNNWMIEEGVREMNIPPQRVLAACVAVQDDLVTETLLDIPSDEGKAVALRRVGLTHPDVVFGNSVHDYAMLEMARVPFPVNPSVALAEKAAELGWPVYYPGPPASS